MTSTGQPDPGRPAPVVGRTTLFAQRADDDAMTLMLAYRSQELTRVQKRAEKWTAGLAALTGVLTTAVVIKGPDSFTKLDKVDLYVFEISGAHLVIVLTVLGGMALAAGIFCAYKAANGSPFGETALEQAAASETVVVGAANLWRTAVKDSIKESRDSLSWATKFTLLAGVLLTVAILVTWFTPAKPVDDGGVCTSIDGKVVQFEELPSLNQGSLTVVPCPKK